MEKMFLEILRQIDLDPVIVLLVLMGGYGARIYLEKWTHIRIGKWRPEFQAAWKTLIVGTVLTAIYVYLSYKEAGAVQVKQVFYSYTFATCLYPFIKRPFNYWMTVIFKKLGFMPKTELPPEFEEPERPGYPPQTKTVNKTDMPWPRE